MRTAESARVKVDVCWGLGETRAPLWPQGQSGWKMEGAGHSAHAPADHLYSLSAPWTRRGPAGRSSRWCYVVRASSRLPVLSKHLQLPQPGDPGPKYHGPPILCIKSPQKPGCPPGRPLAGLGDLQPWCSHLRPAGRPRRRKAVPSGPRGRHPTSFPTSSRRRSRSSRR